MKKSRYFHIKQIWENYLSDGSMQQADRWLTKFFKENKKFGSKDRKIYADIFFSSFRYGLCILRAFFPKYRNTDPKLEDYPKLFTRMSSDFFLHI